ncbi:MAG: LacI family transcriptional regulator [Chloroflexi bacterium]|nr:LacI family transcriptional regulator [Chloroflexota bacterium]
MSSTRPTIRDVARLAGVSHQTVSRVINHSEDVTPGTRDRVDTAILELGYRPSAIARSMARGETRTLACISPNLTDYTFASIIEGAEQEARSQGYFLLSSSAIDANSFEELIDELVGHRRVDGLLIINPYADARHQLLPGGFPLVFVGAHSHGEGIPSVCLDDQAAASAATRHLLNGGRRRLALITGPLAEDCSVDRRSGFLQALETAGIAFDPGLEVEGDWSATSGREALLGLARRGTLPDAVFAQNDRMALGVLRAARDLGLSVPGQLAVIGVDDMPLATHFDPPLTTMRQDMPRIGREAARLLLEIIKNPQAPLHPIKLPAELVIRQSTQTG